MIDTHAHLNFKGLAEKADEVVRHSQSQGVSAIIIASSDVASSKKAVELAKKYPGYLWASLGIHPQKTDPDNNSTTEKQLNELKKLLQENPKGIIAAIGECGFDFSPAPPGEKTRSFKRQKALFLGQINLALNHGLPLIVHVRQANEEALDFIKNFAKDNPNSIKNLKGVFHCYSGGKKRIKEILELPGNWFFGFDGNLTYDQGLENTFLQIPKEKIVVETDAPFLAPEPHRGEINTPAYLPYIVKKASKLWNLPFEKTKIRLRENTLSLFTALQAPAL